jgi:hypothetical protein
VGASRRLTAFEHPGLTDERDGCLRVRAWLGEKLGRQLWPDAARVAHDDTHLRSH